MFVGYCAPNGAPTNRQNRIYKHLAPTALTLALPHKRQSLWNTENLAPHPFTIYDSQFTNCN
jgi:hypothetical protein